eukprot:m.95546 g.95546  ORF g.95546 m.95546 type:complete len:217 (-) comp8605_c0_seq2:43-693(-)
MAEAKRQRLEEEPADGERPVFVLAHGAGATSAHPGMKRYEHMLARLGDVVIFDYQKPYSNHGRLVSVHRQAIERANAGTRPLFLVGHSMGGRISCHVVAECPDLPTVSGLVSLSYPLISGGGASRAEVLTKIPSTIPTLFIHGTKDTMCPSDAMQKALAAMTAPHNCLIIDGGNHGLVVPKRGKLTQDDADRMIFERIQSFVTEILATRASSSVAE